MRAPLGLSVAVLLAVPTMGCSVFRSIAGTNTVDLSGAEVQSMGIDIRRTQKTICPREPVQMAVFMEVMPKGGVAPKSYETWVGRGGVNKNDKLDFSEFAFHSDHGTFDQEGWFTPNPDLRRSLATEFLLVAVYKKQPDKFTFDTKYKPSYACVNGPGRSGSPGTAGRTGNAGNDGTSGASGSTTSPGGGGGEGQAGQKGTNGGDGGDGPRIALAATLVKTPFYDQLVAVRVTGDVDDFLLFPIDTPISVLAAGGDGGSGGAGGRGGRGGSGGSGNPGGHGGAGGRGGDGGNGGNGGRGGEVELTIDPKHHATLSALFRIDVHGGAPGAAGPSGPGGSGGSGGSGQSGPKGTASMGSTGTSGASGARSNPGARGGDGRSSVKPGNVADAFGGITGLEILGGAPAPEPPKADPPKTAPKGKK